MGGALAGEARKGSGGGSRLYLIPNFLSALRLPVAAAFFVVDGPFWRGVLLLVGALSDALDGWLARRLRAETATGAMLDPLFDKLFVTVALAAFLPGPYIGWREFAVLVSRDAYVGLGFLGAKALGMAIEPRPRASGKLVTFLQIVTLFVLLLAPDAVELFVVVVGVAAAYAVVDYTIAGVSRLRSRFTPR
jgi:phosphatidylglycerophosphate synthase